MDKKTIGLIQVTGDILHAGHFLAFEEAKKHCDYLIACTCAICDKPCVQTLFERFVQLKSCKFIDDVYVCQDETDKDTLLKALNYDVVFVGEDHKQERFKQQTLIEKLGKEIIYLSRKHDLSSSNLKSRITDANKKRS